MTAFFSGACLLIRASWPLFLASALILVAPPAPTSASSKQKPRTALLVQEALTAEAKGKEDERGESLARIIETDPDFAPARWAAGYVQRGEEWVKYDEIDREHVQNDVLAEYRQLRDAAPDSAGGHLKIAKWCHSRGLPDERRAHLLRALDLDPNRADIRELLKMVQVSGVWMLPGEARQAVERGNQAVADLKHWLPKIERIRLSLSGPAGRQRDMAAKHVRTIHDHRATVALETVLAPASDEAGMAVVDALAAMKRPAAALALARLATFSESLETTDAARAKLKTLSFYSFVPAMLSSLVVPGVVQTRIVPGSAGRLLFHQSIVYEGTDRKVAAVFDNAYRIGKGAYGPGSDALVAANALGSATTAMRALAVDARNHQLEQTNHRIMETLRVVTGQKLPDDPRAWWQWWNALNEIVTEGSKPTDALYVSLGQFVPSMEFPLPTPSTRPPQIPAGAEAIMRPLPKANIWDPHSCLIAGTPIWTDRGPVAIEAIRIGDRVLAQDVVSGELAYKPVLRTTIRRRAPLFHISLPGEVIIASGGHPFWIAGQSWMNAKQLIAGMMIHTVTGTVPITAVREEKDADQPVFNLIVEDFHNYFAAKSHLLLHDNTMREPTTGPVPGWMDNDGTVKDLTP